MSQLLELLKQSIEKIKAHPLLQIEQETIAAPAPPDLFERLELMSALSIPSNVKEFYAAANGLTCSYRLRPNMDENTRRNIQANGEQADFNYDGIYGSIRLLPIQESLLDTHWKPPSTPSDANTEIDFSGIKTNIAAIGARTKIFDRYEVQNDEEAMAFLTNDTGENWQVLLLDNYLADWQNSRLTDFDTYIRAMAASHFTIPSRHKIFEKFRGDNEPLLRWENLRLETLTPSIFQ